MKTLQVNLKMVITAIAILCICLFLFDKCNNDVEEIVHNDSDSLKQVIAEQTKVKDSLLLAAKKKDTIRVEIVKRYRVLKTDTIYQVCEPIIKLCDSIILVDSSQISDLKNVIKVDSNIIANYKKVTHNDSLSIVGLKKESRKYRRQRNIAIGAATILGVIAIIK